MSFGACGLRVESGRDQRARRLLEVRRDFVQRRDVDRFEQPGESERIHHSATEFCRNVLLRIGQEALELGVAGLYALIDNRGLALCDRIQQWLVLLAQPRQFVSPILPPTVTISNMTPTDADSVQVWPQHIVLNSVGESHQLYGVLWFTERGRKIPTICADVPNMRGWAEIVLTPTGIGVQPTPDQWLIEDDCSPVQAQIPALSGHE